MTEHETASDISFFEKQARENLSLSPKQLAAFLKQARALRRNLQLRRRQKQERQKQCTHSK